MNNIDLNSILAKLSGLASSGPFGIAAMVVGIALLIGFAWYVTARANRATDSADEGGASSDAGSTGQSLDEQAKANDAAVAQLENANPPTVADPANLAFAEGPLLAIDASRAKLWRLWTGAISNHAKLSDISYAAHKLLVNRTRYEAVGKPLGIPFYVVGVIHMLESDFNFTTHLHNGDSLKRRTVHVPRGRPLPPAKPPFTWEQSARDALTLQRLNLVKNWDLVTTLDQLERYNGLGYRLATHINSPYLWSYTNQYSVGKFGRDGHFDPKLVSRQCGVVPVLKALKASGIDLHEVAPA